MTGEQRSLNSAAIRSMKCPGSQVNIRGVLDHSSLDSAETWLRQAIYSITLESPSSAIITLHKRRLSRYNNDYMIYTLGVRLDEWWCGEIVYSWTHKTTFSLWSLHYLDRDNASSGFLRRMESLSDAFFLDPGRVCCFDTELIVEMLSALQASGSPSRSGVLERVFYEYTEESPSFSEAPF